MDLKRTNVRAEAHISDISSQLHDAWDSMLLEALCLSFAVLWCCILITTHTHFPLQTSYSIELSGGTNDNPEFVQIQKTVVRLNMHNDKEKQEAMKVIFTFRGIDSVTVDMKKKKIAVIGRIDPVDLVSKLRERWCANLVFVE